MSKTPDTSRLIDSLFNGTQASISGDVSTVPQKKIEGIGRASKTGSLGQTLDGLRVAVSVNWGEYPAHMTRQIIVTVGKLRVYEAQWCDTSRLAAVAMLEKILTGCDDSILADFRRFLGEVVL
jgi:hypothetical protein